MKSAAVLYMPALHKGYIDFLTRNGRKFDTIFLISEELVKRMDPELASFFEKDLRAVPVLTMQKVLVAMEISNFVEILEENNIKDFNLVIAPEDDIVEKVLLQYYPFITPEYENCFLRWGRKTILSQRTAVPDAIISVNDLDKEIMNRNFLLAKRSSDWWRQVGAIIFPLIGEPIESFNRHIPHEQAPYINGDPRSVFKPGENIDLSTAIHAEAGAISFAAKKGISLEGASMYSTTLPCPPCAWLIREAGIKRVYYTEGYSLLGVVDIFKSSGISLIFVDIPN
jgi:dCMP deaminase